MCIIVFIEDKDVRTVGELKAAIGPEHVAYAFDVIDYVDEECLCGVRIRESAERAGYECRERGMDYEFIKKPESEGRDGEA